MINIIEETIKPYSGVGRLKLGMTLPEIRAMPQVISRELSFSHPCVFAQMYRLSLL